MYWRKHHDLHGWVEQLYVNKGGTEMFNGIPVVLSLNDLDLLERDIKNWNLLHTTQDFSLEIIRQMRIVTKRI